MNNPLRMLAEKLGGVVASRVTTTPPCDEVVAQKLLQMQYRSCAREAPKSLPSLADVGFRKYSQFEEDGILLFIFALISCVNRRCVEICAGNGQECMTTNLILNHGWWGALFDGNSTNVELGRKFFTQSKDTFLHPPVFTQAWVTAENVNDLVRDAGMEGEIDLFSLDIDGMDYWVWKALTVVNPRVVVCETHNPAPASEAVTVPYDPEFVCESEDFRGASLAAMNRLAKEKGYRLIGVHRFGFNAFFLRNDVGVDYFPEVSVQSCINDPFSTKARSERWPGVKDKNWEHV